MIRKWLNLLKNYKLHFAGSLVLAAATIITGIGLMSTSGYLISRAAQRPMLADLFMITAAVRFFGISRAVVRYFDRMVSHDLTFKILLLMRTRVYRSIDSMSLAGWMGRRPGDLLARLVTDIEALQNAYLRIVSPVITALFISLITILALWVFDPILALAMIFFHALSGIAVPLMSVRLARGRGKADVKTRAAMKIFLVDRIQGLQDILWLGMKKSTEDELTEMQHELDGIQYKNAGVSGMLEGLNSLLSNVGMFAVMVLAIPLVMKGDIPGVMLAMLTLGVLSSFEAMQALGNSFLQFENYVESSGRLFSLSENKTSEIQIPESPNLPGDFSLSFRDVSFSFEEQQITLQNVSFEIPAKSKTAIVGPTGSGKSTLANLMMKFWEPQRGEILLGGNKLTELDDSSLRSLFSVAPQDIFIFNRSLRENLLIANPQASDEEVTDLLRSVGLQHLTDKLCIETGNQGMKLSGGERQLFSIARSILKRAPIWVLDEPSANLDVQTEKRVFEMISEQAHNKTLILITHRLTDMDRMDQIIVLSNGKIVEKGKHFELLTGDTLYRRMYQQQMDVIK
ncbi:MAG: thiol reductant ABC exporter subunit CydC [Bacteroidales bacterium]|nr:thiol reductant ABC exporter subunit CydC [Bacteroidales bacterium]